MTLITISLGAQKVLYAFRVPRSFSTVFGQFYGAESKKVGAIIFQGGEKSHFRDLSGRDCAQTYKWISQLLMVVDTSIWGSK